MSRYWDQAPPVQTQRCQRDDRPKCEHCRAPIRWAQPTPSTAARSEAGRNPAPMPLDYEPDPRGLFSLYEEHGRVRCTKMTAGQAAGFRAAGNLTYQQHYKSCPKKFDWGKPGKPYGSRDVTRE